jgi:hypothetical protein
LSVVSLAAGQYAQTSLGVAPKTCAVVSSRYQPRSGAVTRNDVVDNHIAEFYRNGFNLV